MNEAKRAMLFWFLCIPTRLALALAARAKLVRAFALNVSYRWLSGLEDSHRGFFGGRAWWAGIRRYHGMLWGLYGVSGDARFLYADVAFGGTSFWFNRIYGSKLRSAIQ